MSQIIHNIKLKLDEELDEAVAKIDPSYSSYRILRRSVDARRRHEPHLLYSVEIFEKNELPTEELTTPKKANYSGRPVLIVGAGPAGLFAALNLAEQGVPTIIFDRGGSTHERIKDIAKFWRKGELNPENNVCYGEGGAGLFSDGKLITRIKSPHIPYVLDRLVQFGAPEEIRYFANPHVGSDRIRRVIPRLRQALEELGCEIRLNTRVDQFLFSDRTFQGVVTADGEKIEGDHLILATGHSAEDVIHKLHQSDVSIEGKSYAVGLRIEHSQEAINKIQYRQFAGHPKLGSANYRLTYHDQDSDTGVYSFCMCPGGYVLSCGTTDGRLVSNGMSNYNRNSPYANAAIVTTIDHKKLFGETAPLAGLTFRQKIEESAYRAVIEAGGSRELPAQRLTDYFEQISSPLPKSSCPSGVIPTRLDQVLPESINHFLKEGINHFDRSMRGFKSNEALLIGVETRTSCPIRLTRDSVTLQSISHSGLYPTGEGAGYAGGITSAACDGVKVSQAIIESFS